MIFSRLVFHEGTPIKAATMKAWPDGYGAAAERLLRGGCGACGTCGWGFERGLEFPHEVQMN
ncbi:MAG: hypothetical protein RLZZ505_494 [Verrucomicrobiota bacterium]|jgi:hypothetical protein